MNAEKGGRPYEFPDSVEFLPFFKVGLNAPYKLRELKGFKGLKSRSEDKRSVRRRGEDSLSIWEPFRKIAITYTNRTRFD